MTTTDTPTGATPNAHPLSTAARRLYELTKWPGIARLGGRKFALGALAPVQRGIFTDAQATVFLNLAADELEAVAAAGHWPEVAA